MTYMLNGEINSMGHWWGTQKKQIAKSHNNLQHQITNNHLIIFLLLTVTCCGV